MLRPDRTLLAGQTAPCFNPFMTIVRTIGIICVLTSFSMARELATSYKQAAALGDTQESAEATKDYFNRTLLPYYGKAYAPVLQSCFAKTSHPDDAPFSFVVAIREDGRVLRIYNDHETNIFLCLRQSLSSDLFPQPPVSPYYLHIDMRFTK